ncbi:MAG: flavodoxin domain-containing protein [Actinomycetota bacterium]
MKVLVTAASKHAATAEIAKAIGETLTFRGFEVAVLPVEEVAEVRDVDAVVIGSAVYAGHWLKPAKEFVTRNAHALSTLPVWLFSSGPVGNPPKPEGDPADVAELVETIHPRGHHVFPGRIERGRLTLPERAVTRALRIPDADSRDLHRIRGWAVRIAAELEIEAPVVKETQLAKADA